MFDPRNVTTLTFGLVATPEEPIVTKTGKIVKLRAAVDYAGQEKNSDNRTGYFDITYYANDDNPNSKFVLGQIEAGNFKPGTKLQLVGRLHNERWANDDGKKNSRVVIIAEALTYAGGPRPEGNGKTEDSGDDSVELPNKF